MKVLKERLPIWAAIASAVIWVYSTFATTTHMKSYVDSKHTQVLIKLEQIEKNQERIISRLFE